MAKKSLHLIINPNSGYHRAPAIIHQFSQRILQAGFTLHAHMTVCVEHARETLNQLQLSDQCIIAVVGGDGTITEAVDTLSKSVHARKVPLACIPAGNGNDFAKSLNIPSPQVAIERILRGRTREIDVLKFTLANGEMRYGVLASMWGYMANAAMISEHLRGWGPLRYTLSGLIEFFIHRPCPLTLVADGEVIDGAFDFALATNTPYFARHVEVAPEARLDNGVMHLVWQRQQSRMDFLKTLLRLRINAVQRAPHIENRAVKTLQITPQSEQPFSLDARWVEQGPVTIEVQHKALRVIC